MKIKRISTIMAPLSLVTLITSAIGFAAPPTQTSNFADPAFKSTWTRTDEPVSSGEVKRSDYLPGTQPRERTDGPQPQ